MEFMTTLNVIISSAGVVLNLVNIRVFLLQDWRTNNVTLTLLSLSITDLLVVGSCLVFDTLSIVHALQPTDVIDYLHIQYYVVGWTLVMFSDISSLTTVLVSLERCLCIILPLHVHSLFSVKKMATAQAGMWILIASSYTVLFSTLTVHWTYDHSFNTSKLVLALSKERKRVEMGHNIANAIILPTFCEFAVVINTVAMVIGLKRSSQFQRKSLDQQRNMSATSKYKRLAIVVCCISGIFIACNTPVVIFIYCKHFIPGFTIAGVYSQWHMIGIYILFILYAVNASVNFFVYFFLNQRFRDKLRELLGGRVSDFA
ncbi:hypothetical protein BsWGS_09891 [Bradybaena similaris]